MIWLAIAKRWAGPLLIVAAIGAGYAYHRVQLHKAHTAGYRAAEAEMAARVSEANAAAAALEERQRAQSHEAAVAWESKRNELESQVARLLREPRAAVRLCKPASGGGQLPGTASAASSADGQPQGGIDAVRMGRDIGGAAVVLAAECERYRQQLSALQRWVRSATPAPPP